VVIGGGPGGYVAAIKLAQLGKKVLCVEGRETLGGTCLNIGCIPSKTLLEFSEKYHSTKHLIEGGILTGEVGFDFAKLMQKKSDIVKSLTGGIAGLFKKNKVERMVGFASFIDNKTIIVNEQQVKAKNFVIATGSVPTTLPDIDIDEEVVLTSTGALSLKKVPQRMAVIGGGVIGLEMASVYARLGSEVTVVEFAPNLVPSMDGEVSKTFKTILEKQGIKFLMETKMTKLERKGSTAHLSLDGEGLSNLECDAVLIAVGR